jgi:hypothetical protein
MQPLSAGGYAAWYACALPNRLLTRHYGVRKRAGKQPLLLAPVCSGSRLGGPVAIATSSVLARGLPAVPAAAEGAPCGAGRRWNGW